MSLVRVFPASWKHGIVLRLRRGLREPVENEPSDLRNGSHERLAGADGRLRAMSGENHPGDREGRDPDVEVRIDRRFESRRRFGEPAGRLADPVSVRTDSC